MHTIDLHQLPIEVLVLIIQYLSVQDIYNLILTCKTLKNIIINDNAIWRSISLTRLTIHGHQKNRTSNQSWYNLCRTSHNWSKAIYKYKKLIYYDMNYMPWLKFHDMEVLLLTKGSNLCCYPVDINGFPNRHHWQWQFSMPDIIRNDKRTNDISRFVVKENLLACGNRNGSVALYKVDKINSKPHLIHYIKDCLKEGMVEVSAVDIVSCNKKTYMVTASMDSPLIQFWNWNSEDELEDVHIDRSNISSYYQIDLGCYAYSGAKCMASNEQGNKMAIGPDGNNKPVMVDINTGKFEIKSEYPDASKIVQDIQWHDENTICYVTHSGLLQMMDIRTHQVVYDTEDPFQASFYCVKTDGVHAILAGTSQHARCVLYDSRKPHYAQLYFTQKGKSTPVYSLDFDSTKLIAALDRGVTALNFKIPSSSAESRDYSQIYHK